MRSATSSIPGSRAPAELLTRRARLLVGAGLVLALLAGVVWWTRPPAATLTAGQVLALLPAGSTLHSLARLDLDGAAPLEAAAVVGIPRFPGAQAPGYVEVVARYDRWRRRYTLISRRPPAGSIPISVDAGRILGDRDGVLFQALDADGRWSFRVVGLAGGRVTAFAEGVSVERVTLSDPLVIDRGARRALAWDGRRLVQRALPSLPPPPPAALTWRFAMRNGVVAARTDRVVLRPRQTLRVQPVGGGTTPIVIADPRLDVVENGFRARQAGTYSIRVLAPSTPIGGAYVLTVLVADTAP